MGVNVLRWGVATSAPVLQVAAEVLQQYQRHGAGADFALGVIDAVVGVNGLVGSGAVAEAGHGGHNVFLSRYAVSQAMADWPCQAMVSCRASAVVHLFG
jgi:hypothetical protein